MTPNKQHWKRRQKPSKPFRSFPLTPHNNGQWCKKIRGKVYFFGVWKDPQAALDSYLRAAADLHAGRQPSPVTISPGDITVKRICNHYLTYQAHKVDAGELKARSFEDCRRVCESFARFIGPGRLVADLTATDFQRFRQQLLRRGLTGKGKSLGVYALTRTITIIKGAFKYAYEIDLIGQQVKYGRAFDRPSAASRRRSRQAGNQKNGKRLFGAHDIRAMIDAGKLQLRGMILLGINGGFGNSDCGNLPIRSVDFDQAAISFDRPKTGVERVVPLWPETLQALREIHAHRPQPTEEDADGYLFLTALGQPWVREKVHRAPDNSIEKVVHVDALGQEFDKLLRRIGVKRKGLGFYTLRHTFRTWADEVRDQHAIHRIMGHSIPGMSGIYVEEISQDRLRTVVDHVRRKVFGQ